MQHYAIEAITSRKFFYRDNYYKMTSLLIIVLGLMLIANGCIIYLLIHRPQPKFYATSTDGKLIPLTPLHRAK